MMKEEFEKLVGHDVGSGDYKVIEECYVNFCTLFDEKQMRQWEKPV